MTRIWVVDFDGRTEHFDLPLKGSRAEVEPLARTFLPDVIKHSGLRGMKGWGIVDQRARVRR